MTAEVQADQLYWDGNGAVVPDPAGGSGTWSGSELHWFNGSTHQAYNTGAPPHDTVFGVSAGTVDITEPVTARSLQFDVDGYLLSGSTLTLTGTGAGSRTIDVASLSDSVVISASVAGTEGLIKSGDGELVLSGANTFAGLSIFAGSVRVSDDLQLGDLAGPVGLDGGTLLVTGASSLKAEETRNFHVGHAGGTFDIQNTSNTGLTIDGVLSGTGSLVKVGDGTLRLGDKNHMFAGGITIQGGTFRFNNNNDAGPKALRMSPITFAPTSASATLSLGGSGSTADGEGSELRTGQWTSASPGDGNVVAATTLTDSSVGASGHDLMIFALADAEFSGTVSNLATSNGGVIGPNSRNGDLAVRGIATQTLSGMTYVNETISVFSGAGLTLAGDAMVTGDQVNLNVNGGTFTLDNSTIDSTDRFRDSGPVETRGGGQFVFVGNAGGSSETLGNIQLGSNVSTPKPRAGTLNVRLEHHAGDAAATVLTFAGIQRDAGRATIDFSAHSGQGTLDLGTAGSAPRVLLTAEPSLSASGLFDSPGGVGWATVNGADFATYDVATGVKPANTVPFASATGADNALLTTTAVITGASNKMLGSLKIGPSAGQTLDLEGSGNLQTPAILLAGPNDFQIRNTGSGTGGLAPTADQYVYVQQADLTIDIPISGSGALVKSGAGTLILEGENTYSGPTAINEGQLRVAPGTSLSPGVLELRGGVLEIAGGGTFNRHLDYGVPSGPGRISWTAVSGLPTPSLSKEDRGSGGFAAVGADVVVDLNGLGPSDIVWEDPAFVDSGYAMILGSQNADAVVELVDNFGLGLSPSAYNAREIRVIDNPDSTTDMARLSGIVFSDSAANNGMLTDLLKSGDGTLELTGDNTYIGGTIVAEGALLLGHENALGQPVQEAYVQVGSHGGATDAALLTSAAVSIARDITVPGGGDGRATLGTTAAGSSYFTGEITVGSAGATAESTVDLFAEEGGTAIFASGVNTAIDDLGLATLNKKGPGEVILDAISNFGGHANIDEGLLRIDWQATLNCQDLFLQQDSTIVVNGILNCHDLYVGPGSTLAGNGYITADRVVILGILSPGESTGMPQFDSFAGTFELRSAEVPEPSTMALLGIAAVGFLVRTRRKRNIGPDHGSFTADVPRAGAVDSADEHGQDVTPVTLP